MCDAATDYKHTDTNLLMLLPESYVRSVFPEFTRPVLSSCASTRMCVPRLLLHGAVTLLDKDTIPMCFTNKARVTHPATEQIKRMWKLPREPHASSSHSLLTPEAALLHTNTPNVTVLHPLTSSDDPFVGISVVWKDATSCNTVPVLDVAPRVLDDAILICDDSAT